MKTINVIICLIFSQILLAQPFVNLDLDFNNINPSGIVSDFFGGNQNNNGITEPWEVSHGTPDLEHVPASAGQSFTKAFYVSSGKGLGFLNCNQPNNIGSEGLFYEHNFIQGHRYTLRFFYKNPTNKVPDRAFISLTTGLPEDYGSTPTQCNPGDRSYAIPSHGAEQVIFEIKNTLVSSWQEHEICIIPEQNFNQLWFSINDDDPFDNIRQNTAAALFGGLSIECCTPIIEHTGTEIAKYPGTTTIEHAPLPGLSHAALEVVASTIEGDIIVKEDEGVVFKAGDEVLITASNGNDFIIEIGGEFDAIIEDCNCDSQGNNYCQNYMPSGAGNVGGFQHLFLPNIFDPSGNNGPEVMVYSIEYGSQYSMPYNAHKATFRIFDRWGGLVHEQIIDRRCDPEGIPHGALSWDGCINGIPAPQGVYTMFLELENCYEPYPVVIPLQGGITLVNSGNCNSPRIQNEPGINSNNHTIAVQEQSKLLENDLNTGIKEQTFSLLIFPLPAHDYIKIRLTPTEEIGNIPLILKNIQGSIVKSVNVKCENGEKEQIIDIDISELPAGTYFLSAIINDQIISKKVIVQ
ncbi:MAG: T9SS type A sorting domain-containing protein [Saprospiraceae bacterium]